MGSVFGIVLGVCTLVMGAKGFTAEGIPLIGETSIRGVAAKIVGVVCILLGALLLVAAVFGQMISAARQ